MSDHITEVRRNLSLAACQPCRKAKVGCDHVHPCSRCIRRGLQHQCVYRTAEVQSAKPNRPKGIGDQAKPELEQRLTQIERSIQNLQRQFQSESPSTQSRKRRRDIVEEPVRPWTQQSSLAISASTSSIETFETKCPSFEEQAADSNQDSFQGLDRDEDEPSLVGPGSDSWALHQFILTREQFKGILDELPFEPPPMSSTLPPWVLTFGERRFRQSRLELGERVVKDFPPKVLCDELLRIYFEVFNYIRPIVPRHWASKALEEVFQFDGFMQSKTPENISNTAARIDSNSFKGLSAPSSPPSVNWNIIGMLSGMFAIAAYTAPQLLDIDTIQFHIGTTLAEGVQSFAFKMRNLVGICWQLYNPLEKPEESSVLLVYFYIWVYLAFGEYIPFIQHLYGCLVPLAAMTSLHREAPKNEDHSDEDIQRRRAEYAAIYHLDKIISTYTGRPPLIFRRFSNTLLPSTATEEESYLRGQFLIASAREEVLELLLTSPRSHPMEKILCGLRSLQIDKPDLRLVRLTTTRNVQRVILERYNSIPSHLKYDGTSPMVANSASLNTHRVILYLFSLENSFHLQNVVLNKVKDFPESMLLKVSVAMFSAVVRAWENRAYLGNFTFIFSWLLTTYGSASAGIIFSSILREQTVSDGDSGLPPQTLISKSYRLQQLHQFLYALSSIHPTDPHFHGCKKSFRMFSKVNEVLGGGTVSIDALNPEGALHQLEIDQASSDSTSVDYSNLGWLNSNLGAFGALPWMDHVWMDFGEPVMLPSESEQTSVNPPYTAGSVTFEETGTDMLWAS